MRLTMVTENGAPSVRFVDADGDGIDDETGEPVETPADSAESDETDDGDEPDDDSDTPPETTAGARHRWLLAIEGTETGDGRSFADGALTWRELPMPFMALDTTTEAHQDARLVANIVEIERDGGRIEAVTEDIVSDDDEVLRLQRLIAEGDLRGVSVDLDQIEGSLVIEVDEEMPEPDENGVVEIPMAMPKTVFTKARIMGATAVPFPAFAEAQRISSSDEPLVASAATLSVDQLSMQRSDAVSALCAAIDPPTAPPLSWYDNPALTEPTPLTVDSTGRVYGHLALWDSCHIGFADRCVQPPRSEASYSVFHSGMLVTAEGETIRVGQITVDCGHADLRASAPVAAEHYDHTGWAAADVRCGEDDHGIWIAGSVRPGLAAEQVRSFMAADVSGDWRRVNGSLELVGIASVNVPGFSKAQFDHGERVALVAAVPVCDSERDPSYDAIAERIASTVGLAKWQQDAERDRLALSIGAHPSQRRAELLRRVRKD